MPSASLWLGATDAKMDVVELMRHMEGRFIAEAEQRCQEEREQACPRSTISGSALAQAGCDGLGGMSLGAYDPLRSYRILPRHVGARTPAPIVNLTVNICQQLSAV